MTTTLRPSCGGFLRPFGCGLFIRDFLLGNGPQGSSRIDPNEGAPQVDIRAAYKEALYHAFAQDQAKWDISDRVRRGETVTEEQARQIQEYYFSRIPYKITKCRYHSFITYFGLLKRLGWVEEVSQERSGPQEYDDGFQPRRYYRLTNQGRAASLATISGPITALYNYPRNVRSAKRHRYYTRRG